MSTGACYVGRTLGLQLMPNVGRFLDLPIVHWPRRPAADVRAVLGWGLKGKSEKAIAYASRTGLPYVALEDGFLRSIRLGDTDGPLSIVVDDLGIYYNANSPSRLESLISSPKSVAQMHRARDIRTAWCTGRLSKYNHAREQAQTRDRPYVLVVDQTFGDASIRYGMADASTFHRMLEAAIDENPQSDIVLKVHPDVVAGRKRANFNALTLATQQRVELLASNVHPPSLLESAGAVYVVTSQMGFEALLWEKPVRVFGMPFYAGWGLTADDQSAPPRRSRVGSVPLDCLVHAALVDYPRYIDPETLERCEPERLMEWMALQRRMRERFPAQIQAKGFSTWKRPIARLFLAGSEPRFVERGQPTEPSLPTIVWGVEDDVASNAAEVPVHVEDGFLRSVGLGTKFTRPLSLVFDRVGIYYDANRPSELEQLLETARFDSSLLARARALRVRIVEAGITKYNVGDSKWQRPDSTRRVVLVPGQVESDASITYGNCGLRTNRDLVLAVRACEPDAYLIYKPHPDVVAGKRPRGEGEEGIGSLVDEVVTNVSMHRLLGECDEIHVLTSLTGFEGLLRGKKVVCHGRPFYAGWGLTHDRCPHPRRTRRLCLDELIAAALISYPTYVSKSTDAFTTPERALDELAHWNQIRAPRDSAMIQLLRLARRVRNRWRRP